MSQELVCPRIDAIRRRLVDPADLGPSEREGFCRRHALCAVHFQRWLAAACLYAKHPEARRLLQSNFEEELRERHNFLLIQLSIDRRSMPSLTDLTEVHNAIEIIDRLHADVDGLTSIASMWVVESSFAEPIMRYLGIAAGRSHSSHPYLVAHSQEEAHSRDFAKALLLEATQQPRARQVIERSVARTAEALEIVYHIESGGAG